MLFVLHSSSTTILRPTRVTHLAALAGQSLPIQLPRISRCQAICTGTSLFDGPTTGPGVAASCLQAPATDMMQTHRSKFGAVQPGKKRTCGLHVTSDQNRPKLQALEPPELKHRLDNPKCAKQPAPWILDHSFRAQIPPPFQNWQTACAH